MEKKFAIDRAALREIRANADWKQLFLVLGISKDAKKSKENDWWGCSPFTSEKTPSFHLNDKGFYCFSTHKKGGVVELVQEFHSCRGQILDCFQAGQWLLDHGVSFLGNTPLNKSARSEKENDRGVVASKQEEQKKENLPIRQSLISFLREQGTHPEFIRRGISKETCEYLGCGYIPEINSKAMRKRIVFQVRGIEESEGGHLQPTVLTHLGRATTEEQEREWGKWRSYEGFSKTLELYNIDNIFLDPKAIDQIKETKNILIVEGCFDVAKLVEAGILNVVATFGAHLSDEQAEKINQLSEKLGVGFLVWYDRDKNSAGQKGQEKAIEKLQDFEIINIQEFDWGIEFLDQKRGMVKISEKINDVCDFSIEQLQWLRMKQII